MIRASFEYVGPTPAHPGGVCAFLPGFAVGLFDDNGYAECVWLFWVFAISWGRAK